MAHSNQSRRSYLQSLGSQALVDLSDCCCFRSLPRLGELVDQILFEWQVAQPPLPLDPETLVVLPYRGLWGAAAPLYAGRAWGCGLCLGGSSCRGIGVTAPEALASLPPPLRRHRPLLAATGAGSSLAGRSVALPAISSY